MIPGNYARTLFETPHSVLLELLSDSTRKENLSSVFEYIFRKVYRCKDPLKECPLDVQNYENCAVEMGTLFLEHFDYVEWPNYLHKIFEHVQQLVEDPNGPGSVGAFSSQSNEAAGNKLVRHFRKKSLTTWEHLW